MPQWDGNTIAMPKTHYKIKGMGGCGSATVMFCAHYTTISNVPNIPGAKKNIIASGSTLLIYPGEMTRST